VKRLGVRDDDSLFGRASRALGWSFVNTAVGRFGTLAIGIALARLLGPKEFGTFAVAMVVLLAVLSFNELGVSLAIVRWPGEPREIAPTVTTISVVSSGLIYLGAFLGAPAFATAMGAPAATAVIRLLAVSMLLDGITAVPHALLQRTFRQDRKMLADQLNNWGGTLLSIALAVAGMGAMSLAIGRVVGSLAAGVVFVIYSPEPLRFGFDPAKARALLRFGLPLAGSSIIVFAVANVDQLIVGNMLGATALGFYVLGFNLSNWPVGMFSQPVRSVAPAAFARLQGDPPAMHRTFLSTAVLLAGVTLPVCLLISGAAQPLIRFVYGQQWAPASAVLLWLAILGGFRIIFELIYDYFVVLARSRAVFTVQLIWLVALVPALVAGARVNGISGLGAAHVLVAALVVLPLYLWELHRAGVPAGRLLVRLGPPVLIAAVVGLAARELHRLISFDLLALALAGGLALGAVGLLLYRMRDVLRGLRTVGQTDAP
jgi:O-antigen/teichoic acid export membrane protein